MYWWRHFSVGISIRNSKAEAGIQVESRCSGTHGTCLRCRHIRSHRGLQRRCLYVHNDPSRLGKGVCFRPFEVVSRSRSAIAHLSAMDAHYRVDCAMQGQARGLVLRSRCSALGSYLPSGKGALHTEPRPVPVPLGSAQTLKLWIP